MGVRNNREIGAALERNGNGETLKIKMAPIRSVLVVLPVIAILFSATWAIFDMMRTGEATQTLLQKHISEMDLYLDKQLFDVTLRGLEKQVDELGKTVKEMNAKLDAFILKGK